VGGDLANPLEALSVLTRSASETVVTSPVARRIVEVLAATARAIEIGNLIATGRKDATGMVTENAVIVTGTVRGETRTATATVTEIESVTATVIGTRKAIGIVIEEMKRIAIESLARSVRARVGACQQAPQFLTHIWLMSVDCLPDLMSLEDEKKMP
jgi:hypothetical protein